MAEEDWDTGAEQSEFQQDKFNKFDPNRQVAPPAADIVQSEEKPEVPLPSFENIKLHSAPSAPSTSPVVVTRKEISRAKAAAPPTPQKVATVPPPLPQTAQTTSAPSLKSRAAGGGDSTGGGAAFTTKLDPEALQYFNELGQKPFSTQAIAFLNAYWPEVGDQADFIFSCAWEKIKYADMHSKGIQYIHLYDEGCDLDFNIGLYFYEKLCKEVLEEPSGRKWRDGPEYKASMPSMMTALVRKQELREKVDVNFDGRISFLEYLLYQYREYANPADFVKRSMAQGQEHPEVTKARRALEDVNKAIREYEKEKSRLVAESQLPGVKGLGAKAQLAILNASPLAEKLNEALISAEAAVRIATKKYSGEVGAGGITGGDSAGAIWWMNRDLADKKSRYGRAQ